MYINAKRIPVETALGIRRGGIKDNSGGSAFKYDVFNILYVPLPSTTIKIF
jgi:hypothetical protein